MDWLDWLLLVARVVVVFFALLIAVMLVHLDGAQGDRRHADAHGPEARRPARHPGHARRRHQALLQGRDHADERRPARVTCSRRSLAMVPAFLAFAVIPFGTRVTLFGRTVPFQIADLDIGILWILAMASIGVYGVVLAGWSSGSNYPLLGSIRSTRADGLATRWGWASRSSP